MYQEKILQFDLGYHITAAFPFATSVYIRQAQAEDIDSVIEMHQRLSKNTIYKRYHSPRIPKRKEIESLCGVNGGNSRSFLAVLSGVKRRIVGMACYVIDPDLPISAEIALLVADGYQGQGIGRKLMDHLVEQALFGEIRFIVGHVQATNSSMIHLLESSGSLIENHISYGVAEMCVQLLREAT